MDDINLEWPALTQLRSLRDWPKWACQAYPRDTPQIGLFYTPALGFRYPRWSWVLRAIELLCTQGPVWQIFVVWMPAWTALSYYVGSQSEWHPGSSLAGLLSWTWVEYAVHRWLFHNPWLFRHAREVVFALHFVHHKQPHDLNRLTAPLALSLPIGGAVAVASGWWYAWDPGRTLSWLTGFVLGYIGYDLSHYWSHTGRPWLRAHWGHLGHHNACHRKFGFSTGIWDWVFGSE